MPRRCSRRQLLPTLSVVSGENQSGYIESALPEPFVVEVLDQYADPMKDIAITFTVTAGDGSLSHENVNTDKDGMAQSTLTFGAAPHNKHSSGQCRGDY